jgi:Fe-S cluster biogenesis protein NfuA
MIPFTDEELMGPVAATVQKVRPGITADGGDIKLITIRNGIIYVQLQGACVGCGSSGTTIKYSVEKQMKIDIHPELQVRNLPIGMENDVETFEKQYIAAQA